MTLTVNAKPTQFLSFRYLNWKGDFHTYVVEPLSVEFGPYTEQGTDRQVRNWVLHANSIARDGEERKVGRRTFLLSKIEELRE